MALTETDRIITKNLKAGDIATALRLAETFFEKHSSQYQAAHVWLSRLQSFCFQNKTETKSTSIVVDVSQLTELLCRIIANNNWQGDRLKLMQCLYHIVVFIMKYDFVRAHQISTNFISLKAGTHKSKWTSDELTVLTNLTWEFAAKIIERLPRSLDVPVGLESLKDSVDFLCEMTELHDFFKFYKTVAIFNHILLKAHSTAPGKLAEVLDLLLVKLDKFFCTISSSKMTIELPTSEQCFESFTALIQNIVILMPRDKLMSRVGSISSFLDNLKIWLPNHQLDFEVVNSVLKLCESLNSHRNSVETNADRAFACVNSRKISIKVCPTVLHLLADFTADITSSVLVRTRLEDLSKFLHVIVFAQDNTESTRKRKDSLEAIAHSLQILTCESVSKEGLVKVFQYVRIFTKKFENIVTEADLVSTNFILTVRAVLAALQSYKAAELYDETEKMCQYIFNLFIKIDPEKVYENHYLKSYVELWLRYLTFLSQKKMMGSHAQVQLIVFALAHPRFTIPVMKAWAALKKSKSQLINADATVLDVFNVNIEEIKEKFPSVKLDINVDVLLLAEVFAYTKIRDLSGGPVFRVFKTAAKVVKNHVALANILCCTIDAYTFDVSDISLRSSLRTSLSNLIAHMEKLKKSDDSELKCSRSVLLCTLGNLFYHKARLETQQLRRKAEEIEKERESGSMKGLIPQIRKGDLDGKDNLDVTEVTMVSSNETLRWSCCDRLIPLLKEAINHWRASEPSLEPDFALCGTLSYAKGAGYLLRLYGYRELEISCWQLLYKMATKLKSDKYKILAAGELFGVCKVVDSSIRDEVDDFLKDTKRVDVKCYAHHLYRVNLVKNLFLQGKFEESRAALKQANEATLSPHFAVAAQHRILAALLEIVQPKDGADSVASIEKIFSNLLYIVKNDKWETFNEASIVQLLLIETSTLLATLYADMKNIRKARAYLYAEMKLIHNLGLPAKVCEVLALRCWVDLLTCNITASDCNAGELESLLQLGVVKNEPVNGSPLPNGSSIKCVPHFLQLKDCHCSFCSVADYPTLVLNAIIVRIFLLLGNKARCEAQLVMNLGRSVVELVKEKERADSSLIRPFSASVARFHYTMATAYVGWRRYKEANNFASLASEIALSSPIRNPHLIGSIKRLLLGIQWIPDYHPLAKQEIDISSLHTDVVPSERAFTPEAQKYNNTKPWISTEHNKKNKFNSELDDHRFVPIVKRKISGMEDFESAVTNSGDIDYSPTGNVAPKYEKSQVDRKASNHCSKPGQTSKEKSDLKHVITSMKKLDLKRIAMDELGTVPLPSSPCIIVTPSTPSAREVRASRNKKLENPRINTLITPSTSLAKIGQSTPNFKVFYDPEGVASTTKKPKTAKKVSKLALERAIHGFGTPATTSSRARTARKGLTLNDSSDDDLVMVSGPKKKPGRKEKDKKIMANDEAAPFVDEEVDSIAFSLDGQLKISELDIKAASEDAKSMAAPVKRAARTRAAVLPKYCVSSQPTGKTPIKSVSRGKLRDKLKFTDSDNCASPSSSSETEASNRKTLPKSELCSVEPSRTPVIRTIRTRGIGDRGEHSLKTASTLSESTCREELEKKQESANISSICDSNVSDESVIHPPKKLLNRPKIPRRKPVIEDDTIADISTTDGEADSNLSLAQGCEGSNKHVRPKGNVLEGAANACVPESRELWTASVAAPHKRAIRVQGTHAKEENIYIEPLTGSASRNESVGNISDESIIHPPRKVLGRFKIPSRKPIIADDTTVESSSIDVEAGTNGSEAANRSGRAGDKTLEETTNVLWAGSIAAPRKRAIRVHGHPTEESTERKAPLRTNPARREPLTKPHKSNSDGSLCRLSQSDTSEYQTADESDISLETAPLKDPVSRSNGTVMRNMRSKGNNLSETSITETASCLIQLTGRSQTKSRHADEKSPYVSKMRPQRVKCGTAQTEQDHSKSRVQRPKSGNLTSSPSASPTCDNARSIVVIDDTLEPSDQDSFDVVDSSLIYEKSEKPHAKKALNLL